MEGRNALITCCIKDKNINRQNKQAPILLRRKKKAYLVDTDDLAVNLLDLLQLAHEVPEAGLGDDLVGGKEAHAEKLGGGILLGGEVATDQLVLVKLLNCFNRLTQK